MSGYKVYMVEGYDLITGDQNIIEYIIATSENEACRKYEEYNGHRYEANQVLDEWNIEEFIQAVTEENCMEYFLSNKRFKQEYLSIINNNL